MIAETSKGNIAVMARPEVQLNVRIPPELKTRLDGAAEVSGRTISGEVARRLEDSFGGPEPMEDLRRRVDELERQVAALKKRR